MVKEGRSRKGSLQFSPRKRAKSLFPRIRSWPEGEGLLGFVGYKVGSVAAFVKPQNPQSPFHNKQIVKMGTVIEVPPLKLKAVRLYKKTLYGLKTLTETSNFNDLDLSKAATARLLFETQPKLAGLPMKKSNVVEIAFGGNLDAVVNFAKENMDKEIRFEQFFKENEFLDTTGVTKGRGFQGPVKRWGIDLLSHKTEKSQRKPASLGPWTPKRTPWQAPMAGQTGYHTRTEHNKQILKIGSADLNPKAGWHKYGKIKTDYVVLSGSVQGPAKRPIILRKALRPKAFHEELVEIVLRKGE